MTPTDKLRTLLDDRGIEWQSGAFGDPRITYWKSNGVEWCAIEHDDGRLVVNMGIDITPEQAIAATVGAEPDEATMLKLHSRMNDVLLDMNEEMLAYHSHDRENASSKKLIDCVIAAHQIIEDAAKAGARIEEVGA